MFGRPDPKDELIEALKSERDYLRAKVEELQAHVLALTSTHAYRLLHPDEARAHPEKPGPPDPYTLKAIEHVPERSLVQLERDFVGYSEPEGPGGLGGPGGPES